MSTRGDIERVRQRNDAWVAWPAAGELPVLLMTRASGPASTPAELVILVLAIKAVLLLLRKASHTAFSEGSCCQGCGHAATPQCAAL
jgi:hypothetical protein